MSDNRPLHSIRLYNSSISGHCHRVTLFMALIGLPFETIEVDLRSGEQRSPDFLRRNAFGQVPVMEDGDVAHAPEGNVSLEPYPKVRAWLARIETLPGLVPMVASRVGLAA